MNRKGTEIIALVSLIVAVFALLFGENIYQQLTGHSIYGPRDVATSESTLPAIIQPTNTPVSPTNTPLWVPAPVSLTPTNGYWTQRVSMTTPRDRPGVVGLNGKIYVFGGSNASGALNSVEIYDPATDTWTAGPSMPGPKSAAEAVVINKLIYVLGGDEFVYSLDPSTNAWSARSPLPISFSGPAAIAVLDGKIYLTQGSQWMYCYDPVSNSWTSKTPVPVTRSIASFAALNGKLYAIGGNEPGYGRTEIARIDIYDPVTDSWVIGGAASLDIPRTHLGSPTPVVNGRIYVIGGWDGYSALASVEEYNPATNTWRYVASMPMARYAIGYGVLDNKIYAVGGNYGGAGGHWQNRNDEFTVP